MVLATFAGTKVAWLPGRNPATQTITVIREFGKKERLIHQPTLLNWKISRYIFDKHDIAVRRTGGIVGAQVIPVSAGGGASYLRGIVDEVNLAFGLAVVSGVTVDYNAMLSGGGAPRVGDEVGVVGRSYGGMIVADPMLSLD